MTKSHFHIHVDGTYVVPELQRRFEAALGFTETNFAGHPEGYKHFEPTLHLTKKLDDKRQYRTEWDQAVAIAKSDPAFRGYLEGEFIPLDEDLVEKPYLPGVPVPFRITRRKLKGAAEDEPFRRSEIHLTMDKDRSDPRLITDLLDAGLYGAYIPKADHVAITLTAQSVVTHETGVLAGLLMGYVGRVGGAVRASIKEEMAINHHVVGIEASDLPEVIDQVEYL